ncbi:MAG: hypothetical protein FD166_1073 [Bacteroidetes bacterium]|nr:MAG: hypothetical protein FD166_1073 [Bacteroidota bacterium]
MDKKYYGCLIIVLFTCQTSFSQGSMSSLNDSSGAWRVNYINDNGSGGTFFTHDHYRYTFNGDTVMNDLMYHKLYKGGHSWAEDFFAGESYNHLYYSWVFSGAIREEGSRWYYNGGSDAMQESLLYDFSLNPGDPLPITFNNYIEGMVVTNVDTVVINNIPRRRMFIEGYNGPSATYIIEGIGSNTGPIEPIQMFEPIWYLVCYAESGEPVWNESGGTCDLTVNVDTKPVNSGAELLIFPDPVVDKAKVRFSPLANNGVLFIFDAMGRIMEQENLSAGQSESEIRANLKPGIYFLSVNSSGFSASAKFIVR